MTFPTRPIGKTSLQVPVLGFGTAPLGGMYEAVDGEEGTATLAAGIAAGMTYIDTAPFYGYGLAERRVGDTLRALDRDQEPERCVISTKVGRLLEPGKVIDPGAQDWPAALPFHPVYDYSYDAIMRSFDHSLQRMGVDRIDILFVHDIGTLTHGDEDNARHIHDLERGGYRALDELRRGGQVQAIGLGVNEAQACLDALMMGEWDAFLLAGRYTLLEQAPLYDLLPACEAAGTSIIIGGAFNSGIMVGGETWNYAAAPDTVRQRVHRLAEVCAAHAVPLPAAALQFPLAHSAVASVLPGVRSRAELAETLSWVQMPIPVELWEALRQASLIHPQAPTPTTSISPYLSPSDKP